MGSRWSRGEHCEKRVVSFLGIDPVPMGLMSARAGPETMVSRNHRYLILVLGLVACCEPLGSPSELPTEPGELCGGDQSVCMDESTLLECEERQWKAVDCDERCTARGGTATGCAGKGEHDDCVCSSVTCHEGAALRHARQLGTR